MTDLYANDTNVLRNYLMTSAHTDYDLSDDQMAALAGQAREFVEAVGRGDWRVAAHSMVLRREPRCC